MSMPPRLTLTSPSTDLRTHTDISHTEWGDKITMALVVFIDAIEEKE